MCVNVAGRVCVCVKPVCIFFFPVHFMFAEREALFAICLYLRSDP